MTTASETIEETNPDKAAAGCTTFAFSFHPCLFLLLCLLFQSSARTMRRRIMAFLKGSTTSCTLKGDWLRLCTRRGMGLRNYGKCADLVWEAILFVARRFFVFFFFLTWLCFLLFYSFLFLFSPLSLSIANILSMAKSPGRKNVRRCDLIFALILFATGRISRFWMLFSLFPVSGSCSCSFGRNLPLCMKTPKIAMG